jgi:hypothetical protein
MRLVSCAGLLLAVGVCAFFAGWHWPREVVGPEEQGSRAEEASRRGVLADDNHGPRDHRRAESQVSGSTGEFIGRVLDESGSPLPGVRILAVPGEIDGLPRLAIFGDEPENWDGIEEAAAAIASAERAVRDGVRDAIALTDAHGRYRLSDLFTDLSYDLYARSDGWVIRSDECSDSFGAYPGDVVSFLARRGAGVRVRIVDSNDRSPDRAEVLVERDGGSRTYSWTPSKPDLLLLPGQICVTAMVDGMESEPREFQVLPDRNTTVTCVLTPRFDLRVRVGWPDGVPIGRIEFEARRDGAKTLQHTGSRVGQDVMLFEGLSAGRWRVTARYPGGRKAAKVAVDVVDGDVEAELRLPPPDERDFVEALLIDPGGQPLLDAKVRARRGVYGVVVDGRAAVSFGPGRFRVFHASAWVGEKTTWWVDVRSASLGHRRVRYSPGVDRKVTVRFDRVARLTVSIPTMPGTGVDLIPGTLVAESGVQTRYAWADRECRADFRLVPHGEYELRVDARPGTAMRIRIPSKKVVTYIPESLSVYRMDCLRAEGYASALGLLEGDYLVGVAGEEFEDAPGRRLAWATAMLLEEVEVLVWRRGRRFSLRVDPRRLFEPDLAGARIEAALPPDE